MLSVYKMTHIQKINILTIKLNIGIFNKMVKRISILFVVLFFTFSTLTIASTKKHFNISKNGKGSGALLYSNDYRLYQNYPNPFNPSTVIGYKLNQSGFVSLKVYNLVGNVVATLVSEYKQQGNYEVEFDASNLTAGVYLYKLQINDFSSVKRMTLIK